MLNKYFYFKNFFRVAISSILYCILSSCTQPNELGSFKNPIKFFLVPAQTSSIIKEAGLHLQHYLQEETGLTFTINIPADYQSVIKAFEKKDADVAILNTFGYIIAQEKYGVQARLKVINRGKDEYYGQIITRFDGLKSLDLISGKSFGFVDRASTSGYLLPYRLFKNKKIEPKSAKFFGQHDKVVLAVYEKKIDAGATFYADQDDQGNPKDARALIKNKYPDVFQKIKILNLTGPIPNDPVVFRKDLPEEIKSKITQAMIKYMSLNDNKNIFKEKFYITDFKPTKDSDYDVVRKYLKDVGQSASDFIETIN